MISFENLKLEKVIFSNTIKKRQFYREKLGDTVYTIRRSYHDIIEDFTAECDKEMLEGLYRNHKIALNDYQTAWKEHLMKTKYSFFLSIKLPHTSQDGFKRTQNRAEALGLYKTLIQEIENSFCGNNWKRNPLHFLGVLEHGDKDFWHIHLAIPSMGNKFYDTYVANNLCLAITHVSNKHKFYNTIIDLRAVHDQEGLCMYMVKELKNEKNLWKDEGSMLFTLRNLFKGIKGDRYIIKKSLNIMKILIKLGLVIKQGQTFHILKPVQYMKKKIISKEP